MTIAAKDIEAADLPDNLQKRDYSPYHFFTAEEWSRFRADTPMTLTAASMTSSSLARSGHPARPGSPANHGEEQCRPGRAGA